MRCQFCRMEISEWNAKKKAHLTVTMDKENKVHVHSGNLEDSNMIEELINCAILEAGLEHKFGVEAEGALPGSQAVSGQPPEGLFFWNKMRIGDSLMVTAALRDYHRAFPMLKFNADVRAPHILDNVPYLDRTISPNKDNLIKVGPGFLTNASNRLDWHFANAVRLSMQKEIYEKYNVKIEIPQGLTKPDIWLTKEEYEAPPVISEPYWIISIGGEPGWRLKTYPFERWQEFTEQNPDILFVQIGAKEDAHPRLQGNNIIDYIGKTQDRDTGIRDLFKLFLNAEGGIGLVSFGMHLMSAFGDKTSNIGKPYIVVAGAREPRSFTVFPGQQYLTTEGCLTCASRSACWHCKPEVCKQYIDNPAAVEDLDKKIPRCVDLIRPSDLTRALNLYYEGGRLVKGERSQKPQVNIAKEIAIHAPKRIPKEVVKQETVETKTGAIEFGGGALTKKDWIFMQSVINTYQPDTVLEFGAGLSTFSLNKEGLKVVTYETDQEWIDKTRKMTPGCNIAKWDGKKIEEKHQGFDMSFVDGPAGAQNREWSTKIASELTNIIIVHDAGRENERKWQARYIKEGFDFIARGGNRCHLWVKKGMYKDTELKLQEWNKPEQVHLDRIIDPDEIINPDTSPREAVVTKSVNIVNIIKPTEANPTEATPILPSTKKVEVETEKAPAHFGGWKGTIKKNIKFVFNGRGEGGAERSITWMINTLIDMGHQVTYHTPNIPLQPCGTFRKIGSNRVSIDGMESMNEACDVLVLYANDWIWEWHKPEVCEIFENTNADRKVMCVNFKMSKIGQIPWTQGWDRYLFLNSTFEKILLDRIPDASTKSMAPPVDLSRFFDIAPNYETGALDLIRHSSQGDAKYPRNFNEVIEKIFKVRNDVTLKLMPAPSFLKDFDKVTKHQKNSPPVEEFLKLGNCFWYLLPDGYTEGGPKVVMEAQAAGLPVIADNHSGCKDRVVDGTGRLCNSLEEHLDVIKNVSFEWLKISGQNAREHARTTYNPMNWIDEILGE